MSLKLKDKFRFPTASWKSFYPEHWLKAKWRWVQQKQDTEEKAQAIHVEETPNLSSFLPAPAPTKRDGRFFRFVTSCHGKPVDSERKAELSSSWSIVWRLPCRPQTTGQKSILKDLFTLTWVYIIVLEVDLWEIMEMYPFLAANVRQHHVKCWRDRCKRLFSRRFSP